jgi:DNA-binding transcriptional LysR family regulator
LSYAWQLTGKDGQARLVHYRPILESDDWLVIKHAAVAGLGVVSMPDELCGEEIAAGRLEIVLPEWTLPSAALHIVYTSRRGLIPAVRAFIDHAAERLSAACRKATPAA